MAIFVGAGVILIALDAGDEQDLTPEDWDSSRAGAYAASFVTVVLHRAGRRGADVPRRRDDAARTATAAPTAVLVTAVVFGLGHGLLLSLAAFVWFGLVTALLRLRTDSVYPCMLVHCAFNATA